MDATGVVLRQPLRFSSYSHSSTAAAAAPSSFSRGLKSSSSGLVCVRPRRRASGILLSRFCDQGHVKYYNCYSGPSSSMSSGEKVKAVKDKDAKKMKKKQLKLLKGLSRDLSTFSQMGFGLDSDGALVDQVKGNMISEATELLLKQLQKLKADKKELKKKMKEEKARSKAARMQNSPIGCEMSSSSESSSSSSDSECGEIIDMNNLKRAQSKQALMEGATTKSTYPIPVIPTVLTSLEPNVLQERSSLCNVENESKGEDISTCTKKIEVCMGGKCKKSGAVALFEEFQKAVGVEGAVSGCKCMGKCRDGPNVKVSNRFDGVEDVRMPVNSNSLCVGVGLEDVDVIVANFLGKNNHIGFAAAC